MYLCSAMKERIYLFNPDHDLALAHGGGHYVPPPFAEKMKADLCMLPMWYASPQSCVVVENEQMCEWVNLTARHYHMQVRGVLKEQLPQFCDATFHPWGWSGTIKRRLVKCGVSPLLLPSDPWLSRVRELAHRRSSVAMHQFIQRRCQLPMAPMPIEYSNLDDVLRFAANRPGCYIKMPWSGSGQGIYHATNPHTLEFERWCRGALKRQRSLLCEEGQNRIMDFAMEFECNHGQSSFVGFSVFGSDFHSQYSHGIVAHEGDLLRMIEDKFPSFRELAPIVSDAVSHLFAPHYQGYLGIDMLLYLHDGMVRINPCVEVNLRATMGLVTCGAAQRILPPGKTGKFKIEYSKHGFPTLRENRIYLTPVFADTCYCAYIDPD